jgi:FixJ family two-component response regulator
MTVAGFLNRCMICSIRAASRPTVRIAGEFLRNSAVREVGCMISDTAMLAIHGFALQRLVMEARLTLPVILITGRHELGAGA